MTPLEDISIGRRIVLTILIVIVVLILMAVFGYLTGRWEEAGAAAVDDPPISKHEGHLLELDREALDKAYKDHIGLVFGVWMKGPSDPSAPHRAGLGARNARAGYEKSMDKIELREKQLKERSP
jgi:hypothetical protein